MNPGPCSARQLETMTMRIPRQSSPRATALFVLAALLSLPSAWAAPSGDEETFQFRKGTRWKYTGTAGGTKTTLTQEVFKISQGEVFTKGEPATVYHLVTRTQSDDPAGQTSSLSTRSYLGVESGYLVTGSFGGVPVRIYKLGSQKGDSWECTDPRLKADPDRVFTHLGVETVSVPAGTFKNARHVQVEILAAGGRHVGEFYIVPGVGIVKTQAMSESNGIRKSVLLELDSFDLPGEF